jgi:hypothetical protein
MRYIFDEQGRTRVFVRGVCLYVEGGHPRRTPIIGKIAIYGWKLSELEGHNEIKTKPGIGYWSNPRY